MNFCPACGGALRPGAGFCGNCGQNLSSAYEARSIAREAVDQVLDRKDEALKYIKDKSDAASDFDQQFSSCMQAKGYPVSPGVLSKIEGLVPYIKEKAGNAGPDALKDEIVEKVLETLGAEFLSALTVPLALASEVYDHAAFGHALVDCALRAYPGGPGPYTTQWLDAFPVPDAEQAQPLPPPDARPAVPDLPPPPPNWQPMVVPPPSPPASGGGAGKAIGGMALAGLLGLGVFFGARLLIDPSTGTPTTNPVVAVSSVAITSAGPISCTSRAHANFYGVTCSTTVVLTISGDVPSQGVTVLMSYPYGQDLNGATMHGSMRVPQGTSGPISVRVTTDEMIYSGCTNYPNYTSTVDVYDGQIVNTGPLLASRTFTYNLTCH